MKLVIVFNILACFVFILDVTCQSQITKPIQEAKSMHKVTQTAKVQKNSNSKSNKEKSQAKKIIEQFLDGVFVNRNTLETFDHFSLFETCDLVDETAGLVETCLLKKVPSELDHQINSRIASAIWREENGALYFILGNHPITKSDIPYPNNSSEYDDIRDLVFTKNQSKFPSFDFRGFNKIEIIKKLGEMESNFDEIEKLVLERVNKSIYIKNIKTMKKSLKVKEFIKENRTYYGVSIDGPDIGFVLSVRNGGMKIIGLVDGV